MTDLVVLSLEPWDAVWRRNQHLVAGLLRRLPDLRVLFVEPSTDPLHSALGGGRPRLGAGLRPAPADPRVPAGRLALWQGTKLLPRRVDARVDERWADAVARAARRAGMVDPILWVNDPTGAAVVAATGWRSLYDITDDWLEAERTPAEHARLVADEGDLMARCAEVVVCSPGLVTTKSAIRPVTLLQNAVDTAAYTTAHPRPDDLPDGPVALYVGTVHTDRMDMDLLAATSAHLTGRATVVVVGPAPISEEHRRLLEEHGVVLLGARPAEQVPAYLQHAEVLLVPHLVNAFTDSLDPIKLYEYQAANRHVVSTPVAGFRDLADPRVLVTPAASYPQAVASVVGTPVPASPGIVVPSWEDRVTEMTAVLDRVAAS